MIRQDIVEAKNNVGKRSISFGTKRECAVLAGFETCHFAFSNHFRFCNITFVSGFVSINY